MFIIGSYIILLMFIIAPILVNSPALGYTAIARDCITFIMRFCRDNMQQEGS